MTTPPALHQDQITRTLPAWTTALHPSHTQRLVQRRRADYLNADGTPQGWYAAAKPEDREHLKALIEQRDKSLAQLRKALAGLKGITEFCKPLLTERLALSVPVDKAQYVFQPFEETADIWTGAPDLEFPIAPDTRVDILATRPVGAPQSRSLLEAALHNFEGEAEVGPYSELTPCANDDRPLQGLTLGQFVGHCRALDLGRQYQDHLHAIHAGPNQAEIERTSIQAMGEALRVQAQIASLKGQLSAHGLAALNALCDNTPKPVYGEHELHCWRFSLFDIPIHEILLIGPDAASQTNPCIVYIPEDKEHPVREFASKQEVGRHLRHRLLQSEFRHSVINLAYKERQGELSAKLTHALFENDAESSYKPRENPNIHFTPSALSTELWSTLYIDHLARMRADARTIAVPTADVDAKARKERLAYWFDIGLNVLNVAAFFVPGLNTVMMGVFAYEIMDSVFTGFEAWEEGDTAQALAQLESLAINAAVIGGFAVGARVVKATGFVDAMKAVWHEDRELLWSPEMKPYACAVELPQSAPGDPLGLHHLDGKTYLNLEGTSYEVFQDSEHQWRVRHPDNPKAYAPPLTYDGDGRWRLDHEQVLQWDQAQLMRRLGHCSEGLDDDELATAMRITETDEAILRRTHVTGLAAPSLLVDALLRLQSDNAVTSIITRVRHGLPLVAFKNAALSELPNLPQWPQDHVLKVYEGPEPWGDAARYGAPETPGQVEIEITRSDLESGRLSQALLAQMNEKTAQSLLGDAPYERRALALNEKIASHFTSQRQAIVECLRQRPTPNPATQTLARQFSGLPDRTLQELLYHASLAERQQLTTGRVPLRIAEEARILQARARLDQALLGLYRAHLANSDSRLLTQSLLAEHPHATATELLEIALADRTRCAALIGQQPIKPGLRSPLRLASGRVGYPLSGRGPSAGAATRRLRALYPQLSRSQIEALQTELVEAGDLGVAIKRLEVEQHTLERTLNAWFQSARDLDQRLDRQYVAEQLMSAWRREGGGQHNVLVLATRQLPELPTFAARLPHIRELQLESLGLQRLEPGFLANFPHLDTLNVLGNPELDAESLFAALKQAPKLRELHLIGNGLTELPASAHEAIGAMPGLRTLNLHGNALQLNDASLTFLSSLPLDILALSRNRITLDETLAAHFQSMVHPRVLHLDANPLRHAPDLSYMARLSHLGLSNCELREWPEGLAGLMRQPQYQLRDLNLSFNRIRTLPDLPAVLRTPFARDVAARTPGRHWNLNFNTLEAQTRASLRASGVTVLEAAPQVPEWQVFWSDAASPPQKALWADLFDQGENNHLLGVLERLTHSAEARQDAQSLRNRVWALLEKIHQQTALRERLEEVAQAYPPTCADAGADAFSALEIEVLAYETAGHTGDHAKALLSLYRKLYRRDKVNELADRISLKRTLRKQALLNDVFDEELPPYDELDDASAYPDQALETGLVDDIEVRLALRQSLAVSLDFPEPSHGMLYRDTARINRTIIDNVRASVLELDADTNARQQWLSEQSGWTEYLKRQHADQFNHITDFWRPGHDYLFYCLDATNEAVTRLDHSVVQALTKVMPETPLDELGKLRRVPLNDAQFKQAMDALSADQQQVETGLLLSLTRQVETLGA